MAALVTVVRVDGNVFLMDPQKPLVQGMAVPEGATLFSPDGGRLILADGTVLPLSAGQPLTLQIIEGVATLTMAEPAAADPEVAALQAAIASGQDPTAIQEAPAAGAGEGGGTMSEGGGFSAPFDIARTAREESSTYRYAATLSDPDRVTVTPASFNPEPNATPGDGTADGGATPTPAVSVSLDAIAIDDIVNLAESGQSITVSGKGGGDAVAGDQVTVTIGGVAYSAVLDEDLGFSVVVPGSLLAQFPSATATLTHASEGSVVTATSTRPYSVDLDAPAPTVQLDTLADDDVINAAESGQSITLTGRVGGDAVAGDTVTIAIGGQQYQVPVADDLTFSVVVPGSLLATAPGSTVTAVVSHTDAAGNTGTATTTHAYGVDTTSPTLGITLDTIAGDDVVNAAEANQSIPVTGKVSGEYAAGDRVTLTVGNQTYTGSVKADGSFSITVPGNQLAQNGSIQAVVSHTDAVGNTGSANTAGSYTVDTIAPVVTISLNTIAGDDVINAAESRQNVTLSGKAGGDAVSGDTVTIEIGGQTYTTTVGANGNFSVSVPGAVLANAGADRINATVSHTDAAGNTGTATTTHTYGVDTTPPTAIADTGSTQQEQGLSIDAAHGVLANDSDLGSDGSTLHVVAINGSSEGVGKSIAGSNGGTFIVQSDGSYRFLPGDTYNSLGAGEKTTSQISYTVSDGHGNFAVTTLTATIVGTNDAAIISGPAVGSVVEDSGVSGGKLATTGTLSVTDIDTGQSSFNPGSATFMGASGTTDGVTSSLGSLSITTDGRWTFNVDDSKVQYLGEGQVRTETFAVKSADGSASQTITIDIIGTNDAPVARADTGSTGENATLTVGAAQGVLTNDSDVDGGTLSVSAVNGVAGSVGQSIAGSNGGIFTLNADGSYSFNPGSAFDRLAAGQQDTTQVSYTVSDGQGGTATSTLTVTVTGTNDAPVARADTGSTGENAILNVSAARGVLANDSDVDGGTLSVRAVNGTDANVGQAITGSNGGTFTLNADGSYSFNPGTAFDRLAAGQTDKTQISYTVSDGQGGTSTSTLTVTVTGTNDAPVARADTGSTGENATLNVSAAQGVLANDSDVDGGTLTVSAVNGVAGSVGQSITGSNGGTFTLNADGSYS
ncbi:retention module-containing protein, partial [uncultured Salinicola sp.]|uniref:retention module-containing protein n=1 Tax=uncultured Salinicola sp. TaxID=1193542 RepID=UPI002618D02D